MYTYISKKNAKIGYSNLNQITGKKKGGLSSLELYIEDAFLKNNL